MMNPIDTGNRKVKVKCDMFGILAAKEHYKTFTGPGANDAAKLFLRTNALQQRGYIERVLEAPQIVVPALPAADPEDEVTRLAGELLTALKAKQGPDSKLLRRRLFALQRLLAGRLA